VFLRILQYTEKPGPNEGPGSGTATSSRRLHDGFVVRQLFPVYECGGHR